MVSGIVNYLDRGTLAVANQLIREDLGLSLGQMGVIVLVRRESRVVRCFAADVGREETGRSVARSLSVHAELVTEPCEATETM